MKLPIAPNGIFDSFQGEGLLMGVPMTFVRLAGCSEGCPECDTDYGVHERLTVAEIIERIQRLPRRPWVWITGGEPTDHEIRPLTAALRAERVSVAMPTCGKRALGAYAWGGWRDWADHIYVSPHGSYAPMQTCGNELNIVPGLNGLSLADVERWELNGFPTRWITPCDGKNNLAECLEFVRRHPEFRLGIQAHKVWGVA